MKKMMCVMTVALNSLHLYATTEAEETVKFDFEMRLLSRGVAWAEMDVSNNHDLTVDWSNNVYSVRTGNPLVRIPLLTSRPVLGPVPMLSAIPSSTYSETNTVGDIPASKYGEWNTVSDTPIPSYEIPAVGDSAANPMVVTPRKWVLDGYLDPQVSAYWVIARSGDKLMDAGPFHLETRPGEETFLSWGGIGATIMQNQATLIRSQARELTLIIDDRTIHTPESWPFATKIQVIYHYQDAGGAELTVSHDYSLLAMWRNPSSPVFASWPLIPVAEARMEIRVFNPAAYSLDSDPLEENVSLRRVIDIGPLGLLPIISPYSEILRQPESR